jgi:hypothetical protein
MYRPSVGIEGSADSASTCELALTLCDDGQSFTGEVQCEEGGFESQQNYCQTQVRCGQQFDLGDTTVTAFNYQDNYTNCSNYTDSWDCYCDYPTFGIYENFLLGDVEDTAACPSARALCEGQGQDVTPVTETCGDFSSSSSTSSCDTSRTCTQSVAVDEGTVDVTVYEYSNCQLRNDEWLCSCSGNRMPEMRAQVDETVAADAVCEQVAELCNDAQWLSSSGEVTCETSQVDVRPNDACNVNLSCGQPLPIMGGGNAQLSTVAPVWLNCYNYGDDAWDCSCGDNDENIPLQLTPGDDLWSSCTNLANECVQTLELDFGR